VYKIAASFQESSIEREVQGGISGIGTGFFREPEILEIPRVIFIQR